MFTNVQSLYFDSSASHLPHNLFTWNRSQTCCLGSIHGSKVQLMNLIKEVVEESATEGEKFIEECFEVTLSNRTSCVVQAKVITLEEMRNRRELLVLVTESNVQIHDLLDNAILFVYTIEGTEFETIKEITPENFANGITFFPKTSSILLGLVNGSILSFNTSDIEGNGIVSNIQTTQNVEPVMDIFASESLIALGTSSGKTCVLELKRKRNSSVGTLMFGTDTPSTSSSSTAASRDPFQLNLVVKFESFNGFPCTNICLCTENMLISSYGSGHIRIFSVIQKRLLSEVYAHKSWINSLHLVPSFAISKSSSSRLKVVGRGINVRRSKKVAFDDEENGCETIPLRDDVEKEVGREKDDGNDGREEVDGEEDEDDDGRSDLEKRSQLLLSVSDDSFVRIWKINQYYPWIQLEWSTCIKNKLLVGATFLNNSPNSFAVTCYDSNQVFLYERKHEE